MKLIIQIPCYNEAENLPETLAALPHALPGVDRIETLVVDDGSRDGSAEIARRAGVNHVLCLPHCGLAAAFAAGLREALRLGADLVVNTDADHQYNEADLPALLRPVLEDDVEIVVGDRGVATLAHFSPGKRLLQRMGSHVVSLAAGYPIPDAACGYRAFSARAARQICITGRYTHTLETLIQARWLGLRVAFVPVGSRPTRQPSHLFRSLPEYVARSAVDILRFALRYRVRKGA